MKKILILFLLGVFAFGGREYNLSKIDALEKAVSYLIRDNKVMKAQIEYLEKLNNISSQDFHEGGSKTQKRQRAKKKYQSYKEKGKGQQHSSSKALDGNKELNKESLSAKNSNKKSYTKNRNKRSEKGENYSSNYKDNEEKDKRTNKSYDDKNIVSILLQGEEKTRAFKLVRDIPCTVKDKFCFVVTYKANIRRSPCFKGKKCEIVRVLNQNDVVEVVDFSRGYFKLKSGHFIKDFILNKAEELKE